MSDEEIFLLVLVFGDNSSGLSFVLVRGQCLIWAGHAIGSYWLVLGHVSFKIGSDK